MTLDPKSFAAALKMHRDRHSLTQDEMALAISTPARTYWEWEHGKTEPPAIAQEGALARLSALQTIAVIRIFGGKWSKTLSERNTIDYKRDELIDGHFVAVYWGAPPPSCQIIEEEIEVPEQVVPAHKTTVRRLKCTGDKEEEK